MQDKIRLYIKNNYPELQIIEIKQPSVDNNYKYKVVLTNQYEIKECYADNVMRGKFRFSNFNPIYLKKLIESSYGYEVHVSICGDNKFNGNTKFNIVNIQTNERVTRIGNNIIRAIKDNKNIFKNNTLKTKDELFNEIIQYKDNMLTILDIEYTIPTGNSIVHFIYDKVKRTTLYSTLIKRLKSGNESDLLLDIGEQYYKRMLLKKFNISDIDFIEIIPVTLNGNKKTYSCTIKNNITGMVASNIMVSNLKRRGYYFNESSGEHIIRNILEDNNIKFIQQKTFEDCKHKSYLKFDFFIPSKNVCIEYDGEFHFKEFDFVGGKKALDSQIKRDSIKNKYCIENNIRLIRIPYTDKDNILAYFKDIV